MHRLENESLISEIAKLVPVKRHFAHFKTKHYRFWQPALIIYERLRAILHMLKLGITLSSIIICCRNLRAIYFSSPVLACVCVRSTQWKTNLLLKKHKINFHCVYTKLLNTYTLPFIGNNHVFFFGLRILLYFLYIYSALCCQLVGFSCFLFHLYLHE